MFRHNPDTQTYTKIYLHCFLLSLLSGSVNAGAFMASGTFVTHVTGFATLFGLDLIAGKWLEALGILSIPLYFLLGTMVSAYFVDRRIQLGQSPAYSLVMWFVCGALLLVTVAGQLDLIGRFEGNIDTERNYIFLMLLCGASGLQNAAITTFTGSNIRTTHLTGVTTDLGISLVKIFTRKISGRVQKEEHRNIAIKLITIFSFILGSMMGTYSFIKLHYLGFLIPTLIAAYAAFISRAGKSY